MVVAAAREVVEARIPVGQPQGALEQLQQEEGALPRLIGHLVVLLGQQEQQLRALPRSAVAAVVVVIVPTWGPATGGAGAPAAAVLGQVGISASRVVVVAAAVAREGEQQ
jgi:hypothetical protein